MEPNLRAWLETLRDEPVELFLVGGAVREAQDAGEVRSREEALVLARRLVCG